MDSVTTARLPQPRLPRQFETCSFQPGDHSIAYADAYNILVVDQSIPIELSPTQYRIVRRLLLARGCVVSDEELSRFTPNIGRHIDALRERLKGSGIAVVRAVKVGYLIGGEICLK